MDTKPAQGDCNDASASLNPADSDGDGYSTCQGDFEDDDPPPLTRHTGKLRRHD